MAQYKIEDITNVFWASNDGFKVGRDPMGIQNSSIATYGCLLPGLTNLTGHIRYYSLYCWLLAEYMDMYKSSETELHQYNFIRRAELIMAFIMKDQGVNAVVGANFVSYNKYEYDEEKEMYIIDSGADYVKGSDTMYWSYTSGAFGQYYLGSLLHFKLVKTIGKGFVLDNEGEKLAKAFRNSVDENIRELFLDCVIDGGITDEKIEELRPIGLNAIALHSEEWHALNNLLVSEDNTAFGTSSLRRDTIYLMLNDLKSGETVDTFVEHRYKSYEQDKHIDASFGWYFYYMCETLHYCIESILCLLLNKMDEMHNPPVRSLLEESCEGILSELGDIQQLHKTIKNWQVKCSGDICLMRSDLKKAIKSGEYTEGVALAIPLLFCLYNEYEAHKDEVALFEGRNDLVRQRGILSQCLKAYVTSHLQLSPKAYIDTVLRQVMNEHTYVAIGKMGTSNVDLRKFILEEGCAVLVEIRYPNETNPRTSSLYNFLEDLKYLDESNGVADNFIKNYG